MAKRTLVLDDFLPYRLSVASNAVSQLIARSYEESTGLKMHEWRVIAVLAEDGELSQQGLVRRTKMDKVTVSRAAAALASRELIRRVADPADARSRLLSLSPAGRRLHSRLAPKALAVEEALVRELPAKEVERLDRLLRAVEETASRLLDQDP